MQPHYFVTFLLWIVFPRSNGLSQGAWAEGRYIMPLGETVKRAQQLKIRSRYLVNWQKSECGWLCMFNLTWHDYQSLMAGESHGMDCIIYCHVQYIKNSLSIIWLVLMIKLVLHEKQFFFWNSNININIYFIVINNNSSTNPNASPCIGALQHLGADHICDEVLLYI